MLNLEVIGKKIVEQRILKGLTQTELAGKLFVTHQAVSKWENGKSIPSIEVLVELTALFDITIEYLLDNTTLETNDYIQMYKQFSREVVLSKYLNSEDPNSNVESIFYLLDTSERRYIINKIISKTINIEVEVIWPYLNKSERKYLLGVILSNKLDYDLSEMFHYLSSDERIICITKYKNGSYKYSLPRSNNYII